MSGGFYPSGGPREYSYTSSFVEYRPKTGASAQAKTSYQGMGKKGVNSRLMINLRNLVTGARSAEMAFLAETGIDLTNGNNAKAIFENFNLILNSQKLFERNLAMLQQLSNGVNNELIDPTKYFFTYVAQGIEKYGKKLKIDVRTLVGPQLANITDKVLGYALEQTYTRFKEVYDEQGNIKSLKGRERVGNREQYKAMEEMVAIIKKLKGTGLFGRFSSLFDIQGLLEQASDENGKVVRKPKLTIKSFDQGGTPLELITSAIAPEIAKIHYSTSNGLMSLTITGGQTGSGAFNNQKADSMIAFANGSVDLSEMEAVFKKHSKGKDKDSSKRVQNIKALEEYLNKVGNKIKHLIVISDKNYKITANWGGAEAQTSTLKNAQSMLGQFGVPGVKGLIDYLANCGPGMIQGSANSEIETSLATYIGYFLFDHLEITGTISGGTNVVNIINLSGTYIPLSVYLEGVYQSIEAKMMGATDYNNLVKVTFSPGGGSPKQGGTWTEGVWQSYRDERENGSTIEYHIMQDIASYITSLMGF